MKPFLGVLRPRALSCFVSSAHYAVCFQHIQRFIASLCLSLPTLSLTPRVQLGNAAILFFTSWRTSRPVLPSPICYLDFLFFSRIQIIITKNQNKTRQNKTKKQQSKTKRLNANQAEGSSWVSAHACPLMWRRRGGVGGKPGVSLVPACSDFHHGAGKTHVLSTGLAGIKAQLLHCITKVRSLKKEQKK